ncbi:MAG TPA: SPOR domain-containing protein [Patescibacteria group bacterium]|nr:SPOR domain-containing protein [Patescibacteria group bacterium]
MASPAGESRTTQELQLEARHLVLMVVIVLVLCVASFMFGRWVERQSVGPTISMTGLPGAPGRNGDANVEEMGDVSKDLTFFDTLEGNQPAPLKPQGSAATAATPRQKPPATQATRQPAEPPSTAGQTATSGRRSVNEAVMIQVFASKDRAAADLIRRRLRAKGYTALLMPDHGTYKVRVGPYADREEATRAASVLREQEKLTTWIP